MVESVPSRARRDLRAFRFRLRHDQILRERLRYLKQMATLALAHELGFQITLDDLRSARPKARKRSQRRNQ
jgi:hypothetical protein